MQHLSRLVFVALSAAALLVGCESSSTVGGGDGSQGGDDVAAREALCERSCEVLVPCTRAWAGSDPASCVQTCMSDAQPVPLLESCVSCLEETACLGATLGCQQGPACEMAFDLSVRGRGFEGLDGRKVRVLALEAFEGETWIDLARDGEVVDGAIDLHFPRALPVWGIPYDVVVLVDADGDGACKQAGPDRAWRIPLGLPTGNAVVQLADEAQSPAACDLWSQPPPTPVLEGKGLEAWNGKTVIAAPIWIDQSFLTVGMLKSAPIVDGAFRVELGDFGDKVDEMAPDSEVRMVWMIDLDGDWICSDADAGGNELVPPVSGIEQRVEAGQSAIGSAPCELIKGTGHDVRLAGTGYDAFEGHKAEGVLIDEAGRVAARARGQVQDGALSFAFARIAVPGRNYQAAIWIDADANVTCTAPPDGAFSFELATIEGDLEWRIDAPATAADNALCGFFNMKR